MKRLVFYHIAKCAGTTLLNLLPDYARYDQVVYIERFRSRGISQDQPTIPPFDVLSRMQVMHDAQCRVDWKAALPNVASVCFFRDPIDRLYSTWLMTCALLDDEVAWSDELMAGRAIARSGFHQYLVSNNRRLILGRWNVLTGSLLYGHPDLFDRWIAMEPLFNPDLAAAAIEVALANIERLDFIGIVEDFNASVNLLAHALGRPPISNVQSHNVRGSGGYRTKIDPASLAAAEACVQLDRIVYTRARGIYERKLREAHERLGGDLAAATEARYLRSLTEPPAWRLVSMGDVLNGTGWQQREVNGDKIARWIGPGPEASLDIVVRKDQDLFVRIRCTSFMSPTQLDYFRLRADGSLVELVTWVYDGKFRYYDVIVPRQLLKPTGFLRLEFDCGQTYPASDPGDPRMLGLEISDVEVGPPAGFRFGQPGTPD